MGIFYILHALTTIDCNFIVVSPVAWNLKCERYNKLIDWGLLNDMNHEPIVCTCGFSFSCCHRHSHWRYYICWRCCFLQSCFELLTAQTEANGTGCLGISDVKVHFYAQTNENCLLLQRIAILDLFSSSLFIFIILHSNIK